MGAFLSGVRATSLSLAVPMTRHRHKVDRDFSSINVENTYNVQRCVHIRACNGAYRRNKPAQIRLQSRGRRGGLGASFVTRAILKAVLYIAQFRKCACPAAPRGFAKCKLTVSRRNDLSRSHLFVRLLSLLPIFLNPRIKARAIKDRATF